MTLNLEKKTIFYRYRFLWITLKTVLLSEIEIANK
jgi:hypothetical protein